MQKRYALFLKVLKEFYDAGILNEVILVGSWCMYFYKDYFPAKKYSPTIRTKDIDFLVPLPIKSKKKIDVVALLKDEGFIVTFSNNGYMRLEHPELMIEFLVPERGRGTDKPYLLPHLGVNAQALRFLDFLVQNTMVIESEGLHIRVPHPAAFGLHKLIIYKRRKTEEKLLKERKEALDVLEALIKNGESNKIKAMFNDMPVKWRKKVLNTLEESDNKSVIPKLSDSNTLSFPDLIGESRRRPRESGELYIRNWIPVFTGNPGFSGQARE